MNKKLLSQLLICSSAFSVIACQVSNTTPTSSNEVVKKIGYNTNFTIQSDCYYGNYYGCTPPTPTPEPTTEPVSYETALETDITKEESDRQNDKIAERTLLIQKKIEWLKKVNYERESNFRTKSAGASILGLVNNQEQSLSTVAYAEGCKRYYSFKSEYKYDRKKKDDDDGGGGGCNAVDPVITLYSAIMQNNGDLMLRGKVEPATDEDCKEVVFDYNSLTPDFMGNINISGNPIIEKSDKEFKIIIKDGTFAGKDDLEEDTEIKSKVKSCTDKCIESNQVDLNLPQVKFEGQINSESSDFNTLAQASTNKCDKLGIKPIDIDKSANFKISLVVDPFLSPIVASRLALGGAEVVGAKTNFKISKGGASRFQENGISVSKAGSSNANVYSVSKIGNYGMGFRYKWNGKYNGSLIDSGYYKADLISPRLTVKDNKSKLVFPSYLQTMPIGNQFYIFNINQYNKKAQDIRDKYNEDLKECREGNNVNTEPVISVFDLISSNGLTPKSGWAHSGRCNQNYGSSSVKTSASPSLLNNKGEYIGNFNPPLDSFGNYDKRKVNDAERKIVESLANIYNVGTNPSIISTNVLANSQLIIYADKATCLYCTPLAEETRSVFNNLNLLWIDKEGNCL